MELPKNIYHTYFLPYVEEKYEIVINLQNEDLTVDFGKIGTSFCESQ
jgi:hypothetical protein